MLKIIIPLYHPFGMDDWIGKGNAVLYDMLQKLWKEHQWYDLEKRNQWISLSHGFSVEEGELQNYYF